MSDNNRIVYAPFTSDQVDALNAYQSFSEHGWTCPWHDQSYLLIATQGGFRCQVVACEFIQVWAPAHMAGARTPSEIPNPRRGG